MIEEKVNKLPRKRKKNSEVFVEPLTLGHSRCSFCTEHIRGATKRRMHQHPSTVIRLRFTHLASFSMAAQDCLERLEFSWQRRRQSNVFGYYSDVHFSFNLTVRMPMLRWFEGRNSGLTDEIGRHEINTLSIAAGTKSRTSIGHTPRPKVAHQIIL